MFEENIAQQRIIIKSILEDLRACYAQNEFETQNSFQATHQDQFSIKRSTLKTLASIVDKVDNKNLVTIKLVLRLTNLLPEAEELNNIENKEALWCVLDNMDSLEKLKQSLQADQESEKRFNQTLQQLAENYDHDSPLAADTELQENNSSRLSVERQTVLANLAKHSTDLQNYVGILKNQNINSTFANQNQILQDCITYVKAHQNLTPKLSVQCTQSIANTFECLWQVLNDSTEYTDNSLQHLVNSQDCTNEFDAELQQWILNTLEFLDEQKTLLLQIQQQKITQQAAKLEQMQQVLAKQEQDIAALHSLQEETLSSVSNTPRSSISSTDQPQNPFFSKQLSPSAVSRLPKATTRR